MPCKYSSLFICFSCLFSSFRTVDFDAFLDSMCRSFESSLEPSLRRVTEPHANLRVPARVYDVEGGAIFAKNSTFVFFDGFAWTPRLRSPSPIMAPGITDFPLFCSNSAKKMS